MQVKDNLLRTESEILIFLMEATTIPEKNKYLNDVYKLLNNLNPGMEIEISKNVKPANIEQFTKCFCAYIYETKKNICLSNDYTKIICKY